MSVFNEGPEACAARRAYYLRCGVTSLGSHVTPDGGVLFHGDHGFRSRSYSESGFRRLLAESGTSLMTLRRNLLGHCATVRLGPAVPAPVVEFATSRPGRHP